MLQMDSTAVERYIHKEVAFRYQGHDLHFSLSHGLFSSHTVDTGTRHLLHMIQKHIAMDKISTVLDVGSGTGILSVSIKKAYPACEVHAIDRDALACAFTARNATGNDSPVCVHPGLDATEYEGEAPSHYDLIVSNIPAKAGLPVLERIITNSLSRLSHDGILACVVVSPLYEMIRDITTSRGADIIRADYHSGHVTFIAEVRDNQPAADKEFPGAYLRMRTRFALKHDKMQYTLDTVYGLPGFDTLPYADQLCRSVFPRCEPDGTSYFWNTGQGHLPVMRLMTRYPSIERPAVLLASRDLLSLFVSRHNIAAYFPQSRVRMIHAPDAVISLAGEDACSLSGIYVIHDPVTGVSYRDDTDILIKYVVKPDGVFCISGKSSSVTFMDRKNPGLVRKMKKKSRGFRADAYSTT